MSFLKNTKKILSLLIVTCFMLGKIKYAPGTIGSLAATLVSYIITYLTYKFFSYNALKIIIGLHIFLITMLFIIGWQAIKKYLSYINHKNTKCDPQEIVIDEFVSQLITISGCFFCPIFINNTNISLSLFIINNIFGLLLPFLLFRIFDIIKPWPIKNIETYFTGAAAIMLDDIAAAFFAIICNYAITIFIIDLFG